VALADAEMVAAMVLIQLAYPGAPVYHSMMPSLMDRRTGDFDGGTWDSHLFTPISVELAHKWGVPTLAPIGPTAAVSGWESAAGVKAGLLSAALCGADTASGIGLRETCTLLTPEGLVLDAEFIDMARVETAGLDTSAEAFSLDMIRSVGPRGNFLKEKLEVAAEKTAWILENHDPEPPDEQVQAELKRILTAAEQELVLQEPQ
jgi:trimethylamine--corrinoid protein Co-methyltransferase